jgi:hypothetical protein
VDYVKINTDASISMYALNSGAGGVIRSSTGFIGAWSKPHMVVIDPMIVEVLSLRDSVIFAKLRGFSRVLMEVLNGRP